VFAEEPLKSALNLGSDKSVKSESGRCCAGVLWLGNKYHTAAAIVSNKKSNGPMRRMLYRKLTDRH